MLSELTCLFLELLRCHFCFKKRQRVYRCVRYSASCEALNVSNTSETLWFDISNTSQTHFKKVLKIFFFDLDFFFWTSEISHLCHDMVKKQNLQTSKGHKKFLGVLDPQCGCFSHAPASGLSSALWIKSMRCVQVNLFTCMWGERYLGPEKGIFSLIFIQNPRKNPLVGILWSYEALNVSNTSETLWFDISNTSQTHFKKVLKFFFRPWKIIFLDIRNFSSLSWYGGKTESPDFKGP